MREVNYPFSWFVDDHAEVIQKVLSLLIRALILNYLWSYTLLQSIFDVYAFHLVLMEQNFIHHLELYFPLDLFYNLSARLLPVEQADQEVRVSMVEITKIWRLFTKIVHLLCVKFFCFKAIFNIMRVKEMLHDLSAFLLHYFVDQLKENQQRAKIKNLEDWLTVGTNTLY